MPGMVITHGRDEGDAFASHAPLAAKGRQFLG